MKRSISDVLEMFKDEMKENQHRYYSFDFCYSHFLSLKESDCVGDKEKSCYVLWGYLASWGMLRGSSFLLQKNPMHLQELVEWIYEQEIDIWEIDVDHYKDKEDIILNLYDQVKERTLKGGNHQEVTLVTKILLGVFGIIPAYDRFFQKTFSDIAKKQGIRCGFNSFNKNSLNIIYDFYLQYEEEINKLSKGHKVKDFSGNETKYNYSKAKIIDMYGFQFGRNRELELK